MFSPAALVAPLTGSTWVSTVGWRAPETCVSAWQAHGPQQFVTKASERLQGCTKATSFLISSSRRGGQPPAGQGQKRGPERDPLSRLAPLKTQFVTIAFFMQTGVKCTFRDILEKVGKIWSKG